MGLWLGLGLSLCMGTVVGIGMDMGIRIGMDLLVDLVCKGLVIGHGLGSVSGYKSKPRSGLAWVWIWSCHVAIAL